MVELRRSFIMDVAVTVAVIVTCVTLRLLWSCGWLVLISLWLRTCSDMLLMIIMFLI